jgi:hypothetical protein
LTEKASLIFGKRFTVLKIENRFPKLNSSSLHARLIFDCQNLAMVGRRNPGGTRIRQHPATGILPATFGHRRRMLADNIPAETGRNPALVRSQLDLGKMARIRPDLTGSGH